MCVGLVAREQGSAGAKIQTECTWSSGPAQLLFRHVRLKRGVKRL